MMKKFLIALMILLATTTCHAKSVDDLDTAQVRLVSAQFVHSTLTAGRLKKFLETI